jgi:hypothetical protein
MGGVKRFRAIGKSYRVRGGDREISSERGFGFWYNQGMKNPDPSPERSGLVRTGEEARNGNVILMQELE